MKPVQYFSEEYLEQSKQASPEQVLAFLEQFRLLQGKTDIQTKVSSKLISLKVPEDLLATFRAKCGVHNLKYQTQIKVLMEEWLNR